MARRRAKLTCTDAEVDPSSGMTTENPKQWRIDNANHLKGVGLELRQYTRWSESWDHDHCSACWAKFAEFDGPEIQHEGYATRDGYKFGAGYEWVCRECFNDLKDDLGWVALPELPPSGGSTPGSSIAC
jgi:hypothetical protein